MGRARRTFNYRNEIFLNASRRGALALALLGRRLGAGCVLRTASASISCSSALVFGGSRVFCHVAMDSMWGCRSGS
jgi:hypothetical protein